MKPPILLAFWLSTSTFVRILKIYANSVSCFEIPGFTNIYRARQTKKTDMKKLLLILLSACLLQVADAQKSRVGITAGVTSANLYDNIDGNDKTDVVGGATIGMILEVPLCGKFSFQPGVHYIQKGTILKEVQAEKISWRLRYAEFNWNFLYNTKGKDGGFYIGGGPVISFAVPSKQVTENSEGKAERALVFGNEPIDNLRGVDYGLNGMLGVRNKKGWSLGASYTLGLRNLTPGGGEPNWKSGCLAIRLGYLFPNK